MKGGKIDRRAFVTRLLADRDEILVVTGLGGAGYDCTAARGDHDLNFCLHGAMGGAPLVALGLAMAQPEHRVVCVLGDGDMLMGLGGLATVATRKPANLVIVVLDNGHYQETGDQPTASAHGTDICGVARAAGFAVAETITHDEEVDEGCRLIHEAEGPVLMLVKISYSESAPVPKTRDGVYMKLRFRKTLLGAVPC